MSRTEDDGIPPLRHLRVFGHQASVNIRLLVHSSARLSPNLLAIIDEGVRESGGDGREGQPVAECKGRREKERRVFVILVHIEGGVVVQDPRHVVALPLVVEGVGRRDRQVLRVPCVRVVQDGRDEPWDGMRTKQVKSNRNAHRRKRPFPLRCSPRPTRV